jgi:GINS complex subunit 4
MDVDDEEQSLSEDEENVSESARDYANLRRMWINEANAPELLKYENDAVERFSNHLLEKERALDARDREDFKEVDILMDSLEREELNRAKYVLRAYLRARLKKVERFAVRLLFRCRK